LPQSAFDLSQIAKYILWSVKH